MVVEPVGVGGRTYYHKSISIEEPGSNTLSVESGITSIFLSFLSNSFTLF